MGIWVSGKSAIYLRGFIETNAFIDVVSPNFDINNIPDDIPDIINDYLKGAFIEGRDKLKEWALEGPPFTDQAPQMASSGDILSALSFSKDGTNPLEDLFIDQNIPSKLFIIRRQDFRAT